MTGVDVNDRPAGQRADKFAERRHELAGAALQTLAQHVACTPMVAEPVS